jgi:hypothetical protein
VTHIIWTAAWLCTSIIIAAAAGFSCFLFLERMEIKYREARGED